MFDINSEMSNTCWLKTVSQIGKWKDAPWRVSTENIARINLSYPSSIEIWCAKASYQILRKTYPWATLAITSWRLAFSNNVNRNKEKVRFLTAYFKIDFATVLSSINDMIF